MTLVRVDKPGDFDGIQVGDGLKVIDRVTISTAHKTDGSESLRFECRTTDFKGGDQKSPGKGSNRTEGVLGSNSKHKLKEGDERWYRVQVYFPSEYKASYRRNFTFFQWRSIDPNFPYYGLSFDTPGADGVPVLRFNRDGTRWLQPLTMDTWLTFLVRVKHSTVHGEFELWFNGVKQHLIGEGTDGILRQSTFSAAKPGIDFKAGIYKSSDTPSCVLWLDGIRVGGTRAEVEGSAPPLPPSPEPTYLLNCPRCGLKFKSYV